MTTPTHEYNGEPTLRFQIFTRTTSKRHLESGATWHLHFSAETLKDAFELIEEEIDLQLEQVKIRDAEELS